jgi:hypothetical protein
MTVRPLTFIDKLKDVIGSYDIHSELAGEQRRALRALESIPGLGQEF